MSKADCKRLQKKVVGDSLIYAETKVNKIFNAYDTNKDDYLSFEEFLQYYTATAKMKPMTVWNNF
jgi:Ca2+-binding EF-hand superfamily protein